MCAWGLADAGPPEQGEDARLGIPGPAKSTQIGVNDFRISDMGATDGAIVFDAFEPAVAYNSVENEYLVVWRGDDDTGSLVNEEFEIFGQRIDAATGAAIGVDFRISDMGPDGNTSFDAFEPAVAYNSTDNEYLVVWRGDDDTGSLVDGEFEIFGQRINGSTGTPIGTNDFRISFMGPNGDAAFVALQPAVAYNTASNEYLVVWASDDDTGSLADQEFEIYGQRLAGATALATGSRVRISAMAGDGNTAYDAFDPAVAYNSFQNEYLVVWEADDDTSPLVDDELEIFGEILSAGGATLKDDFQISTQGPLVDADYDAFEPAVAYDSVRDRYLVVWHGDDDTATQLDDEFEIFGQLLDDAGNELAPDDFRISTMGPADRDARYDAIAPAVVFNPTGDEYLVVWSGNVLESGGNPAFEIYGQRLDPNGAEIGADDFRLSDMGGSDSSVVFDANDPALALDPAGNEYLAVWSGDDDTGALAEGEFEIYGQRFRQPTGDLSIAKSDGLTGAVPGQAVKYTITAANAGPDAAVGARVEDDFPASLTGISWDCVASPGSSCDSASGSGDLDETVTLAAGGSVTFTVDATVVPSATGTLVNTASVAGPAGFFDTDASNDSATDDDTVLAPEGALSITKTDGVTTAVPGGAVTYTVTASNTGPSAAAGAIVQDAFSAELSEVIWSCAASPGSSCQSASGTANLDETVTLAAGGSVTFTVNANVVSSATGTLTNTASVIAPAGFTDTGGADSATDIDTLTPEGDLAITNTDGTTSAIPGTEVTYVITVTNAGPSDVVGATVTDTFPAALTGVTWTCMASAGSSCPASGAGDIAATVDVLAGGLVTFTATGTVQAGATGNLDNTASVAAPVGFTDTDGGNDSAVDSDLLTPQTDLSIVKADAPDPVVAGTDLTYTVTVTNHGPSTSTGSTVSDALPAGVTFKSSADCTHAAGTVTCAIGALAVGASQVASYVVTVDPGRTASLSNTATVTADETDPESGNDTSPAAATAVVAEADLSIAKVDAPDPVVAGTDLAYTLTVTNNGPSTSTGSVISDPLPAGTTFESSADCAFAAGTVTCAVGALAVGASQAVGFVATVDPGRTAPISNSATVVGNETDPASGNDTTPAVSTAVIARTDLSIAKADAPDPVRAGTDLTYTLTVTNNGPSTSTGSVISDPLPAGVTFASSADCTLVAGTVSCAIGALAVGASQAASFVVAVPPSRTAAISNTATVAGNETDPAIADNTVSASTAVVVEADVSIAMSVTPAGTVSPGTTLVYTLDVANAGPSTATGIVVTDVLPAGVALVVAEPKRGAQLIFADGFESGTTSAWEASFGSCSVAGDTVTCAAGTLDPGASTSLRLEVIVDPLRTGTVLNTASVTANGTDPESGNDTASVSTEVVVGPADVGVKIADAPDPVAVGARLTYTLTVTNAGPATATGVILEDFLPAEVSSPAVVRPAGCSVSANTVTCDLGIVAIGASAVVEIAVTVDSAAFPALTNPASVRAAQSDPNPVNDTDTETTTVSP